MSASADEFKRQIRDDFDLFDINKDGTISTAELGAMLRQCGEDLSDEDLKAMIAEVRHRPSDTLILTENFMSWEFTKL
jgi:Ca2+-binding EF-hand superfamily protein